MTETKTRVPLAYVGYWNASHEDRWRHVGRVNAVEVDGHAPGTLMLASIDCERIDRDVMRAVGMRSATGFATSTRWITS
jgi:hypothetical protein